ncbi:hypothetical protein TWF788_005296 [Orbilia oligospora]|uniref:Uncharacterized protein n=1 Tax=Orbilia oligospora TaxID=2813651 RepID=A0A6G1LTR5_ORBOL|nr:hypothetical protein TWF788_005296 [Orbilia oligospora]KAF3233457.1 hypothetical protein TWF192_002166 [Orbilia oligospora]
MATDQDSGEAAVASSTVTTPSRPKRQAVIQRKPIVLGEYGTDSDESEESRRERQLVIELDALESSDKFQPPSRAKATPKTRKPKAKAPKKAPAKAATKASPKASTKAPTKASAKAPKKVSIEASRASDSEEGDAPEKGYGENPDEMSLDEADPDEDGASDDGEDEGIGPMTPTKKGRITKLKKLKGMNTPVALHRRMIRRMKDISYWGDHEVDSMAIKRKEIARPFIYDISAPARANVGKVLDFDPEKEAQELAKGIYIERMTPFQKSILLDRVVDADEIAKYYWQVPKKPLSLLLGPFTRSGQQKKFQLNIHESVSLTAPDLFHGKNGWVINCGNEIQSLDWATQQDGRDSQFLAVGTKFQEAKPAIKELPPGFAPCVCPSQIQIWRIPISKPNTTPKPPPTLDHTILTDWGAPTEIKWRPGNAPVKKEGIIGHFMALFEDGQARLIEVKEHPPSRSPSTAPVYKLTEPMQTLYLNDTLFTVFTWINHHTLAFGCANGSVAIYDLNVTLPGKEHLPKSYHYIAASYICSISSLAPSFPDMIATYSMDGSFNMHDIREPGISNTLSHRTRTVAMSTPIAWCEMAQSLCYPEDLSGVLCMGIRKAKKSGGFLCSNNPGDTVAASTGCGTGLHPFLLNGGRDGKVRIANLVRKYFYSKCQAMQQVWFQLEYAPTTGLFRMLDGFKPEMVVHRNRVAVGLPFYTYHTNITKVGWNNNLGYGTWAAAGTGGGFVRVEDVCLDVHQAMPVIGQNNPTVGEDVNNGNGNAESDDEMDMD